MKAFIKVLVLALLMGTATTALAEDDVILLGLRSVEGDDDFTNSLTTALRDQAAGIEVWQVSDRAVSLSQMSLAYGCEELDASCLSEIAAGLDAGSIIYGTVQRTSARDEYDYNVTLNLFNSKTGSIERTVNDIYPSTQLPPGELAVRAKQLLLKLSGVAAESGSILVRVNVPEADVIVDGQPAGQIKDGALLLENIEPGIHTVQIVGPGYHPYSESVTVNESEQTAILGILHSADGGEVLVPFDDTGVADSGPSLEWLGWTLVGVGGASLLGTIISWAWIESIDGDETFNLYRQRVGERDPTVKDVCDEADAGLDYEVENFKDVQAMCNRADVLEVLQYVFLGTAVVAGGAGAYLLITESDSDSGQANNESPVLVLRPRVGQRSSGVTATVRF